MIVLNICLSKLKGSKVFLEDEDDEECGTVRDVCFDEKNGSVEAIVVEPCSLIPISRRIKVEDISEIRGGRVILKKEGTAENTFRGCPMNDICAVSTQGSHGNCLRDVAFNTENGEITDVFISKNRFSKKRKISINKIRVKDNTIYIE